MRFISFILLYWLNDILKLEQVVEDIFYNTKCDLGEKRSVFYKKQLSVIFNDLISMFKLGPYQKKYY